MLVILLEKSYLCGINNNSNLHHHLRVYVVICLKNRTFVVSTTTFVLRSMRTSRCDLLEKSYLCGINNNQPYHTEGLAYVVICLKNRTFVVSTTTTFL